LREEFTHVAAMRYTLATTELLHLVKENHTYRELAKVTGLSESELCRYDAGHILPSLARAEQLTRQLLSVAHLSDRIANEIARDGDGYVDTTRIVTDPVILELAAQHAINEFKTSGITKVVTPSVDGVPLATIIACRLSIHIVIAKTERERGVPDFIEAEYTTEGGLRMYLYMPRHVIQRNDSILLVDGMVRDYRMYVALSKALVQKTKARIQGIFALMARPNEWKTLCEHHAGITADVMLQIPEEESLANQRSATELRDQP